MRVYCAVNAPDLAGVAQESRMNSQYSEYEARMKRIRRNERLAGCALLVVSLRYPASCVSKPKKLLPFMLIGCRWKWPIRVKTGFA